MATPTLLTEYNASGSGPGGYYARIRVYLTSQDIETNTSYGYIDVLAVAGGGKYELNNTSWSVSLSGASNVGGTWSGSARKYFDDGSFWLTTNASWSAVHEADGTKTLSSSFSWNGQPVNPWWGTWSGSSGSFNLPAIPRATTPVLSHTSRDAGLSLTATLTPATVAFHHRVKWAFVALDNKNQGLSSTGGSQVGTDGTNAYHLTGTGNRVVTFDIPTGVLSQIPNHTSGICTITVDTYSGATLIGTKTITFTITAGASVIPTITSLTIEEGTPGVEAIVGAGNYIQNISKLKITMNGEAAGTGATISEKKITVGSQVGINTDPWTMPNPLSTSGNITVNAEVTDSRGRKSTFTGEIVTVLAYTAPKFDTPPDAVRSNVAGIIQEDDGTYILYSLDLVASSIITGGTEKNRVGYRLQRLESGTGNPNNPLDYSTDTSLVWKTSLTFEDAVVSTLGTYDVEKSYYLRIIVADNFQEVASIVFIAKGLVLQHWNGDRGLGFGGYHDDEDATDSFVQIYGTGAQTRGGAELRRLLDTGDEATTSVKGIQRNATNAETQAGSLTTATVTPASLASRTATESRTGLVELATLAEGRAGTDPGRAITPEVLAGVVGLSRVIPGSVVLSSGSATVDGLGTVFFSGTTFVELRNIFTSAIRGYRIFMDIDTTTQIGIHGVFLTGSTALRTGYDRAGAMSNGGSNQMNQSEWIMDGGSSGHKHFGVITIFNPANAGEEPRMIANLSTRQGTSSIQAGTRSGLQRSTAARNGFRFEGTAAGDLSGWIRVYAFS